jgi:hypothetical protein
MTAKIEGLQGQGRITSLLEGKMSDGNNVNPWVLYKFRVQMNDGMERTFSTFKDFGADLVPGQHVAFVYSTNPYSYTDRNTGEKRESIGYTMTALHGVESPPAFQPQNKQDAADQGGRGKSRHEGWQIGQAWNIASAHINAGMQIKGFDYDTLDDWWSEIEFVAAFVIGRLDKEPIYPPIEAESPPDAPSSPIEDDSETEGGYSAESQTFIEFCKAQKITARQATGWLGISADNWKADRLDSWLGAHAGATVKDAIERVMDRAKEQKGIEKGIDDEEVN